LVAAQAEAQAHTATVLAAAVLARAAARPIGAPDLHQGLAAEYRKLGQPLPAALAFNS